MTPEKAPDKARRLNIDEKRKLEKLLFSDIDKAIGEYRAMRSRESTEMRQRAVHRPDVRKLFYLRHAAKKQMKQYEAKLETMGYHISTYPKEALAVYDGSKIPDIRTFDSQTARTERCLEDLKRTYTLKLFAGGEEAKELFASLAKELAAITK
jgi:hypothetical protein